MCAEFERLGLQLDDCPYKAFAASPGEGERFLDGLRRMQPGVSWRDVFPDMPAHWVPGRPKRGRIRIGRSGRSTFRPYRPGRPCTCTGRTVSTPRRWRSSRPRRVPLAGRHGAGLIEQLRDRSREFHAHVVLDRATSEDTFLDFLTWIEEQRGVDVAVITRPVGGEYLEQSPRPPN